MKFIYCPNCKKTLEVTGSKYKCRQCGFVHYHDPSPCVSILPIKDGKVLLSRRGVEPYKGELDVIGGFVQAGETLEEACKREIKEELGVEIEIVSYIGSFNDIYGEAGKDTIGSAYVVKITGGSPKAADDIVSVQWFPIDNLPEVHSFASITDTLKVLKKWYESNKNLVE